MLAPLIGTALVGHSRARRTLGGQHCLAGRFPVGRVFAWSCSLIYRSLSFGHALGHGFLPGGAEAAAIPPGSRSNVGNPGKSRSGFTEASKCGGSPLAFRPKSDEPRLLRVKNYSIHKNERARP